MTVSEKRAKHAAYMRAYYKRPHAREKRRAYHKKYYVKNEATILKKVNEWQKDNPEAVKRAKRRSAVKHHDKNRAAVRAYRQTPKGYKTEQAGRLRRAFKLTMEQYEQMLTAQGGVCFNCKRPETRKTQKGHTARLAVDHDHSCCPGDYTCGKCIRALLCHGCNVSLGLLGENPDRMRQLAVYVEQFKSLKKEAA